MMEEGFSCRVFDTWGLGESTVSANECELHAGYHEDSEYGLIEFVETEKGYEVVGTSLFNYAMPFIRYKIEDIVEVMPVDQQTCKCGRGLPLKIREIKGRIDDQLTLPGGRIILPVTARMAIKPFLSEGESYQLVQISNNQFVFKIASQNFNQDRIRLCYNSLVELLGRDITVDIKNVQQIEMSGGKLRNIINIVNK
jgi:phenylacetate-CoA ligase